MTLSLFDIMLLVDGNKRNWVECILQVPLFSILFSSPVLTCFIFMANIGRDDIRFTISDRDQANQIIINHDNVVVFEVLQNK